MHKFRNLTQPRGPWEFYFIGLGVFAYAAYLLVSSGDAMELLFDLPMGMALVIAGEAQPFAISFGVFLLFVAGYCFLTADTWVYHRQAFRWLLRGGPSLPGLGMAQFVLWWMASIGLIWLSKQGLPVMAGEGTFEFFFSCIVCLGLISTINRLRGE